MTLGAVAGSQHNPWAHPRAIRAMRAKEAASGKGGEAVEPTTLFQELGPLRSVMFILALWPIHSGPRGLARTSLVSQTTCYTVLVYSLWSVMNVRVFGERLNALLHAADFNDQVFNIILVAFLTYHWLVPVFIWPQAAALARFFNAWSAFQAEWRQLTGSPLQLQLHTRAWLCALGGVVFPGLLLFVIAYTGGGPEESGGLSVTQAVVFFPTFCFFFLTGAVWVTLCRAVEMTALHLRQLYREVRAYGRLWTRLGELATETGRAQSCTLVIYTVYSLALALVTATGVVIAITHSDIGGSVIWQALVMIESLHHIYTVHDAGHRASDAVSRTMKFEMLHMKSGSINLNAEVRLLLSSAAGAHEGPSLGGFAVCSHSGIVEVYNTLFLNVLVLLQFAYSFA